MHVYEGLLAIVQVQSHIPAAELKIPAGSVSPCSDAKGEGAPRRLAPIEQVGTGSPDTSKGERDREDHQALNLREIGHRAHTVTG